MGNKILKYYEIVKLFLKYFKFKMFRSDLLHITVAVVVYIGQSSVQYSTVVVVWYGLSHGTCRVFLR